MQLVFSTKGRHSVNGYNIYHHMKVNTTAKTYARLTDTYLKNHDATATKVELDDLEAKLVTDGYTKVSW